jgi:UDP-glucose 4-epimerase
MKIGKPFKRVHAPAKAGEQKRSVCTPSKMKNLLQWQPEVSFEEGLSRTVDWFKTKSK